MLELGVTLAATDTAIHELSLLGYYTIEISGKDFTPVASQQ